MAGLQPLLAFGLDALLQLRDVVFQTGAEVLERLGPKAGFTGDFSAECVRPVLDRGLEFLVTFFSRLSLNPQPNLRLAGESFGDLLLQPCEVLVLLFGSLVPQLLVLLDRPRELRNLSMSEDSTWSLSSRTRLATWSLASPNCTSMLFMRPSSCSMRVALPVSKLVYSPQSPRYVDVADLLRNPRDPV